MSLEQEKICLMFDRIARTYDPVNRILSVGQDQRWRNLMVRQIPRQENLSVLDVATGTADVLIALCKNNPHMARGEGVDLAEKMLEIGRAKIKAFGLSDKLSLHKADAKKLPFEDNCFDAVTISFGIRNFSAIKQSLLEIARVLKPGGRLLILEFSLPKNFWVRSIYLFYFRFILPWLGGIISREKNAYRYLNETVESFPYSKAFCQILDNAGFVSVKETPLCFGIATLYEGSNPC
ncbi:MAG: bifunctional demethylmenaquinone methyltransferase/2-methoxy-6-polyprenyl-1,4-benzoquinol methylase UbiE [Myxococcales bacterium]|nr:bifunctional demethylmenaquinone methyltransferase/2-methoxy-6-polyprenyl-1,4-benzoquinol methylase UbiE [Myxococcales bacterium]USN51528.1 MAG: bifunctional demethylmenaquinone methyltransferase/2-methoxy-6-polyprenyl-1,4-benzoquinol methylase UbiE [Myxococcales bacterium]